MKTMNHGNDCFCMLCKANIRNNKEISALKREIKLLNQHLKYKDNLIDNLLIRLNQYQDYSINQDKWNKEYFHQLIEKELIIRQQNSINGNKLLLPSIAIRKRKYSKTEKEKHKTLKTYFEVYIRLCDFIVEEYFQKKEVYIQYKDHCLYLSLNPTLGYYKVNITKNGNRPSYSCVFSGLLGEYAEDFKFEDSLNYRLKKSDIKFQDNQIILDLNQQINLKNKNIIENTDKH